MGGQYPSGAEVTLKAGDIGRGYSLNLTTRRERHKCALEITKDTNTLRAQHVGVPFQGHEERRASVELFGRLVEQATTRRSACKREKAVLRKGGIIAMKGALP